MSRCEYRERARAIVCLLDDEAFVQQVLLKHLDDLRFVVDYQDALALGHPSFFAAGRPDYLLACRADRTATT